MGLLPGQLTPPLHASVVRLGASVPFPEVVNLLAHFTGVTISEATARRLTEGAGAAYVAVQTAEVERLERAWPEPAAGAAVQQVSVDGAMAPLVGGEWGEVKTLAIGAVGRDAAGAVRTTELSYVSRRAAAETFTRLAGGEVARRGVERAAVVAGVVDGAEWCQGFLDAHCPRATRILDFPHALQHLGAAAQAVFGAGTEATSEWLSARVKELKEGDPAVVLAALRTLPVAAANDPATAAKARDEELAYFAKRLEHVRYAAFLAAGLPIGSGAVESANKLVVEARLKGAGMHWAPAHVNPMVALRTAICSHRWPEEWPRIARQLRARRSQPRPVAPFPPVAPPTEAGQPTGHDAVPTAPTPPSARPKLVVGGKPTARHPWKRFPAVPPQLSR